MEGNVPAQRQLLGTQERLRPESVRALRLEAAEFSARCGNRRPSAPGPAGWKDTNKRAQGRRSSLDGRAQVRLHWVPEIQDQGNLKAPGVLQAPYLPARGRATPLRGPEGRFQSCERPCCWVADFLDSGEPLPPAGGEMFLRFF